MRRQPRINKKHRGEQARPGKVGEPGLRGTAASHKKRSSETRKLRQKIQPIPTGKDRFPDGGPYFPISDKVWEDIKNNRNGWSGGEAWMAGVEK